MNKLTIFCTLLLLTILSACSLNADQEASLSSAVNEYIEARNNNMVSLRVRMTYPNAIRYLKKQGDDAFKDRFRPENNFKHFQDGTIMRIESEGKNIHVEYEFIVLEEKEAQVVSDKVNIYALSRDEGKKWKFMDREEYFNDEILPKDKRLIEAL